MSIRKFLMIGMSLIIFILLSLMLVLILTIFTQESLYQSQEKRYASYLLADELRQSSDDLTRLARTYVITGDDKYEKMYWDILAIRNGDLPRPKNMERIYWDLVLNYGDKPQPDGKRVPLQVLMEKAGFANLEFTSLKQAQKNSDSLVKTETIAMNAIKGLYDDGSGSYTKRGLPDQALAKRIMHDEKYHEDKALIMKHVNEFLRLIDERTLEDVNTKKQRVSWYQNLLTGSFLTGLFVILLLFRLIYKRIMVQIGGEPSFVLNSMNSIAGGDLTPQDNSSPYADSGISRGLNAMSVTLNDTITNVKHSANNLAKAAEEVSHISHQTNSGVSQQLEDVEQIANSMSQMSTTVSDVAESAEQTSKSVEGANDQVVKVNQIVSSVIKNVQLLAEDVNAISSAISELNKETDDIGSVLSVISEIAEQTNLLALNAAIEAARAGTQGRGFAVVADEVRSLAGRTQSSTAEIHEIISSLQTGASRATNAMKKGLERVTVTVSEVESMGNSLRDVTTTVADINDKSVHIAEASQNQRDVTININQNLQRVKQVANESVADSTLIAEASEQLSSLASELQSLVEKFRTH